MSAVIGALVAAGVLLCLVLLFFGLWIVFVFAIVVVSLVAIVRAGFSRRPGDHPIDVRTVIDEPPPRIRHDSS